MYDKPHPALCRQSTSRVLLRFAGQVVTYPTHVFQLVSTHLTLLDDLQIFPEHGQVPDTHHADIDFIA